MPGSSIALGLVACVAAVTIGLAATASAAAFGQRLAGTADAAALAAADAATGAVPGVPCERAAQVADAAGALLAECDVQGLVATVRVADSFAGLPAHALARAGPAPHSARTGYRRVWCATKRGSPRWHKARSSSSSSPRPR